MRPSKFEGGSFILFVIISGIACQKGSTVPSVAGPAALTIVNAIPNSAPLIPVINTASAISYFANATTIKYGNFMEYSPPGGNDTIYVVQRDSDTANIGPKGSEFMFYGVLSLKVGGTYSLFLTGSDTSSPDYLLSFDSLPYHNPSDSTVGIRFVNLSIGINSISVNLEGSPTGSEVESLAYKGITSFKNYLSNASTSMNGYLFVFRDASTGDSLASFRLNSKNSIPGLTDPNSNNKITFKNVTFAFYGSTNPMNQQPAKVTLIDNY